MGQEKPEILMTPYLLQELDYYKKKGVTFDKFVSVMRDFITVASYNFSELEETVAEMKQKVRFFFMIFLYFKIYD